LSEGSAGEQHIGHGKTEVLQQACVLRSSSASTPPAPGGCLTRRPGRLRAERRRSPSAVARGLPATSCSVECGPYRRLRRGLSASSRPISAVTWQPWSARRGSKTVPCSGIEWPAQGSCKPDALKRGCRRPGRWPWRRLAAV